MAVVDSATIVARGEAIGCRGRRRWPGSGLMTIGPRRARINPARAPLTGPVSCPRRSPRLVRTGLRRGSRGPERPGGHGPLAALSRPRQAGPAHRARVRTAGVHDWRKFQDLFHARPAVSGRAIAGLSDTSETPVGHGMRRGDELRTRRPGSGSPSPGNATCSPDALAPGYLDEPHAEPAADPRGGAARPPPNLARARRLAAGRNGAGRRVASYVITASSVPSPPPPRARPPATPPHRPAAGPATAGDLAAKILGDAAAHVARAAVAEPSRGQWIYYKTVDYRLERRGQGGA